MKFNTQNTGTAAAIIIAIAALLFGVDLVPAPGTSQQQEQVDQQQIKGFADLEEPDCVYEFYVTGNSAWQKKYTTDDTPGLPQQSITVTSPKETRNARIKVRIKEGAGTVEEQVQPAFLKDLALQHGDEFTWTVDPESILVYQIGKPDCKEEAQ
jgi:hypothetical protein